MLSQYRYPFKQAIQVGLMLSWSFFWGNNVWANELVLTDSQVQSLGLKVAQALPVAEYPTQHFPAIAMFHPKAVYTLSAPLSGKVSRLNVVHGSVAKGEVIAEIESPELLNLQSQLLSIVSDLKVARSELERVNKLRRSGAASAKKLQQAQSEVDKLHSEKNQQQQTLKLIGMSKKDIQALLATHKIQSASISVRSPIDGQVFDLMFRLGERVTQNQPLVSLGSSQAMILNVKVPVVLANRLSEGHSVNVIGVGVGTVEHIDPEVDALTQTVDVHIKVNESASGIRPGQRFQVSFLMSEDKAMNTPVYRVSLNAMTQFEGETVVFVQSGKVIKPTVITVRNVQDHQLYFSVQQSSEQPFLQTMDVFVKGSTAIKAAFEASQDSDA